jgi:hypothetical protein
MTRHWSSWKPFPEAGRGGHIEAPIGPGVYEVRRVGSGELVSFGHAASVAQALATMALRTRPRPWAALFGRGAKRAEPLEYRVCSVDTTAAAKSFADGLRSRRQTYMSWRLAGRRAA